MRCISFTAASSSPSCASMSAALEDANTAPAKYSFTVCTQLSDKALGHGRIHAPSSLMVVLPFRPLKPLDRWKSSAACLGAEQCSP